jgi:putative glycerol-1-phosphate prenyltransferase
MRILDSLVANRRQSKKSIAVLIDPDKVSNIAVLDPLLRLASENCVDYFFVGGSLVTTQNLSEVIKAIKENINIPIVLFPGSVQQIDFQADGILFLSLISGRNPDLLIGQHVIAAPLLKQSTLEVMPTGYMLINSGKTTSVAYISNTTPIPEDKFSLAASTAMAGEMLGLKLIYLDAGSGAEREVSKKMISAVRKSVEVPLIVGGGINTPQKALNALEAGADLIVIGNALEKDPQLLTEISEKIYDWNRSIATH